MKKNYFSPKQNRVLRIQVKEKLIKNSNNKAMDTEPGRQGSFEVKGQGCENIGHRHS